MNHLYSLLLGISLLMAGSLLAEQQQVRQTKPCTCKDCKCTFKSNCGCYSNKGCSCGPNCSCGTQNENQNENQQYLSVNSPSFHHGNEKEHKSNNDKV